MIDAFDDSEVADLEDEYELLGELGRGASAIVYRARDRALGRLVAIKVVRAHSIASADDAMLRLAREARTVAKLQHPNIVTVHAVKRLRTGGLALVMQLVPGRTLKQAIVEHGPFAPEQAERVLHDVAEALAYAHAHGVVHRDVKPENIFLDADSGRALLSDFGIAHSADNESRLTMTGAAIGTPAYMAPEQIDGAPADARSDIYSLGLVMWEMLTGKRPWDGESLFNVISKQKQEDLPAIDALRPGVVPPRLQYITERMLQKRAAARWAGADGLLANLDHWVVPNDWRQWEAAHKRRREAARAMRAEQREANETASPSDMATIRFRRDGSTPGSNVQVIDRGAMVTPASAASLVPEDDKPSWAVEPTAPPRRAWRAAMVAAMLIAVGTGAAWYADATGRINMRALIGGSASSATLANANADARSGAALVTDTQVGTLSDSTSVLGAVAADSVVAATTGSPTGVAPSSDQVGATAALNGATPPLTTDRQPTTAVPIVPPESVPPRARRAAPVASPAPSVATESTPAAPAVRATDDAGVVSAGGRHSCALANGRALCWGANDAGQLGNGDVESSDAPSAVAGDLEFVQIAAGLAHTCGVARGGDAYCWGADDRGQLGDATTTSRSAPVRVNSNLNFRVVRSGSNHTCGLTTGAQIACWGLNTMGQVGDGTYGMRTSPVRINSDQRFVSVSTGWNHSCAIAYDGSAWCWGANNDGQLGDGTRTNQNAPQRVQSSLRFTSLSAGGGHTCGVTEDGALHCWGRNAFGQLGIGNTTSQSAPVRVESTARFASVSLGGVHSCARTTSGQAWCWGLNTYGQLGDGSMVNRSSPVRVIGVSNFAVINATGAHTCGTTTDGSVSCWGFNVQGQLGDGTRNHLARPTRVAIPGR